MTKEQYEILKQYENHLSTAKYADYARNLTLAGLAQMDEVYKAIFGKESGLKSGCGKCRLRGLKDLARVYFAYQEQQAKKEEEKRQKSQEEALEMEKNAEIVSNELEPKAEVVETETVAKPKKKTAKKKEQED